MTGLPLLAVERLSVDLHTPRGWLRAVDQVDLRLEAGRTLGIVGESGCGKTMLSRAILQLVPRRARLGGRVLFDGQELTSLDSESLRRLRGRSVAVVFQDPMASLNPVLTIGRQIVETLREHLTIDAAAARRRAIELLAEVGIPAPDQRLRQYPHQLSGGMRQRVAIAIALSCEPRLLIADEPTTALDVTIQAQVLDILRRLRADFGTAVLLITHNLGVVADIADRVLVMYAGLEVEQSEVDELFAKPQHPYTIGLLGAVPRPAADGVPGRLSEIPGMVPVLRSAPTECVFAPRCSRAETDCHAATPALRDSHDGGHRVACLHPGRREAVVS